MYDVDPEMHIYDCPGTLPSGGCEMCKGWQGLTFEQIRADLAGTKPADPAARQVPRARELTQPQHHADHCERFTYECGICTCHTLDHYEREPANMADLEDGIDANW